MFVIHKIAQTMFEIPEVLLDAWQSNNNSAFKNNIAEVKNALTSRGLSTKGNGVTKAKRLKQWLHWALRHAAAAAAAAAAAPAAARAAAPAAEAARAVNKAVALNVAAAATAAGDAAFAARFGCQPALKSVAPLQSF